MITLTAIVALVVGYCAREVQQVWTEAREAERREMAQYSREYLEARQRARQRVAALRRLREMAKDN